MKRQEIIDRILLERERHLSNPGSEWDAKNSPNDWIAIILSCVSEEARRFDRIVKTDEFEHALIKGAAVIVAALEHVEIMKNNKFLD